MKNLAEILNNQEEVSVYLNRRVIAPIKVGKYQLSIQASGGHYCFPKEIFKDYNEYSSFEMFIMKRNGDPIQLQKSSIIRNYPKYNELLSCYDGNGIFGWVGKDLIGDFIDYLATRK